MTSPVMRTPRALARRISSTVSAAETWQTWIHPPSYSARAASRATATLSETEGMPASPSRLATAPSCMTPAPDRLGSSSCSTSGRPVMRWYWSARRMHRGVGHRVAVVGEARRAEPGQLDLLGQLVAATAPP